MIDRLFQALMKKHTLNEIYEMDINELLRLTLLDERIEDKVKRSDSLLGAFGL